jgi:DNA-binding MarR family transcriptional regulator
MGASRYNEILRGVPRMSPALLAKRLRTLEKAGIVERFRDGRRTRYVLTEAGRNLAPAVEALAVWGKTWLPATLSRDQADTDLVMWDMARRINLERVPETRTVLRFEFVDQTKDKRRRWIVGDRSGVELCIVDPGFEVDLYLTTDSRTMVWVWLGDLPLKNAIADGRIQLDGPQALRKAFPSWLVLSALSTIPRRQPLRAA